MTCVASVADCIAAQTGAAGVPGAIPAGPVSRQAETSRYCRACATAAGRGHNDHAATPATASTTAAPAASNHLDTGTAWLDGMWWLPMVTVLTRGERHRNPGAPTSNRQTYRQTSFSSGQTTPADARSRIDYKSLHTVYPAPFKQTLINFHRFAEKTHMEPSCH